MTAARAGSTEARRAPVVLVAARGHFADTPAIDQSVVRAITLTASAARGRWEASSGWGGGAERFINSDSDGEVVGWSEMLPEMLPVPWYRLWGAMGVARSSRTVRASTRRATATRTGCALAQSALSETATAARRGTPPTSRTAPSRTATSRWRGSGLATHCAQVARACGDWAARQSAPARQSSKRPRMPRRDGSQETPSPRACAAGATQNTGKWGLVRAGRGGAEGWAGHLSCAVAVAACFCASVC